MSKKVASGSTFWSARSFFLQLNNVKIKKVVISEGFGFGFGYLGDCYLGLGFGYLGFSVFGRPLRLSIVRRTTYIKSNFRKTSKRRQLIMKIFQKLLKPGIFSPL